MPRAAEFTRTARTFGADMRRTLSPVTLLALLAAACAETAPPDPGASPAPQSTLSWAAPAAVPPPAEPPAELSVPGPGGQGSSIVVAALARPPARLADPHGRVVIVADEEGDAVRVLDAASGAELAALGMTGGPTAVLPAPGGRVVVALRRESAVGVLALSEDLALTEVARAGTAEEPVALAMVADRSEVLVASGFGHTLEGFSLDSLQRVFSVDLPREPRSVVVTGGHAFVSHMVGSTVSDVDLGADPPARSVISLAGNDVASFCGCRCGSLFVPRAAAQGFALAASEGKLWMPLAFSRPGELSTSSAYGAGTSFLPADAALLSIDLATKELTYRVEDTVFTGKKLRQRYDMFGSPALVTSAGRCLLPRAAAVLPGGTRVLVSCLGSDEVVEIDAGERSFLSAPGRAFKVPAGPTGMSVDGARREVFVWSSFDRAVSVLSLGEDEKAARPPAKKVKVGAPRLVFKLPSLPSLDATAALGRALFHATFDRRISGDGRACASCHPEGRDDGLAWSSPKGRLQTPMLAGRLADTAPYGWVGDTRTVSEHVHDTLRRLRGTGLAGAELDALAAYVTGLPGPARRTAPAGATVARGKELFESVDTMCTICHTDGGRGTDGARHDVGSGQMMETPTLRFVAGTAPYFHDGRYATLRELLRGSSGKMGGSLDGLGDADLDALEAYLRTL